MKYIYGVILSAAITMPVQAETLNLFIQNSSFNSTIVAEKADGMKITVAPNSRVENIPLERNSQVKNYVDGQLVCTWTVTDEGLPDNWKFVGLNYDLENGISVCDKIVSFDFDIDIQTKRKIAN